MLQFANPKERLSNSLLASVWPTLYLYDDNLADGVGLDNSTGVSVSKLGTGGSGMFTVTYTFDPIGRKATEALTIGGQTYTITSEYNSRGELTKVTYPDSSISERTYHATGALNQLKLDGSTISTRTYDDGRRLTGETLGNGVTKSPPMKILPTASNRSGTIATQSVFLTPKV